MDMDMLVVVNAEIHVEREIAYLRIVNAIGMWIMMEILYARDVRYLKLIPSFDVQSVVVKVINHKKL